MKKDKQAYEDHLDWCTAGPEDGCTGCYDAVQAGILPDIDPDYNQDDEVISYEIGNNADPVRTLE